MGGARPGRANPATRTPAGLQCGLNRGSRQHDHIAFLYAFDLLALDGEDLRREPLETRKATLASLLRKSPAGISLCEHLEGDGELVFRHACKLGGQKVASPLNGDAVLP
jgi:bifunctional non-homologous end joining protein LigD